MGLSKVWIRTLSDSLLRADQVVGLTSHAAPSLPGKAPRWLLDATVSVPAGSGAGGSGWDIGILHRTLAQTRVEPVGAPQELDRLLARLDRPETAGIITPSPADGSILFAFTSFTGDPDLAGVPDPARREALVG
ncbi:hypothetical protein H4696_003324 [Amycolatopsis lexingtonensis]|uniref:Uncharacterized protein n=1 Tax=Amycolatopsis lexingtonensis TaxID=218822 RepID=A0ABR9HZ91_9PSEU|nr:hypothetical protein [Amycolatopsis lexingtonensis]MBE1496224.1 hypothetical protein [Amycolatopsis lexingtonensis]